MRFVPQQIQVFAERVYHAWVTRPTVVTIPLGMILVGITALIYGDEVSRAFTELGNAVIIRIMGGAMLVGGIVFACSIHRNDWRLEAAGLSLIVSGAMLYGVGVIFGLGLQGLVAGLGYLFISLGLLGRIRLLRRAASRE